MCGLRRPWAHLPCVASYAIVVSGDDQYENFYDIKALSNFATDAPNLIGFDLFVRLDEFVERRYAASATAAEESNAAYSEIVHSTCRGIWLQLVEMTRHAVLTSLPFFGHLGPLLAQGDRLVERGWRVSVASLDDARQYVLEHPQLEFVSLGRTDLAQPEIDVLRDSITRATSFSQSMLTIAKTLARGWAEAYDATRALLERERPAVLVADLSSTAAISAADTLGIACVVNNPDLLTVLPLGLLPPAPDVPLLLSGKSINSIGPIDRYLYPFQRYIGATLANTLVGRPLNTERRSRGLKNVDFQHWLADKQIMVNSAFGLEYPRRLPPNVHMVGPMFTESPESLPLEYAEWLGDGKPVVYVNLGTIARPWRELLQRMAEAFRTERFRTLWVVAPELQPLLPDDLPETVRVERWVPSQLAVLGHPNVRAFVSHCGVNSVHEAIWAGTPVIGMPLFAAQGDMALRVQDARVGSRLDKHRFTPEHLRAQIVAACTDEDMRANIETLRQTFVAAGGVRRAVELIEQNALDSTAARLEREDPQPSIGACQQYAVQTDICADIEDAAAIGYVNPVA